MTSSDRRAPSKKLSSKKKKHSKENSIPKHATQWHIQDVSDASIQVH